MTKFHHAKQVYDGVLERLAEAKTSKEAVSGRIAELEARLPVLEAERLRLTKLAALGKIAVQDAARLKQVRRELTDCGEDLDALRDQMDMLGPDGEVMREILSDLDEAYRDMERAHRDAAEEVYDSELAALKASIEEHMPRIMALYRAHRGMSLDVADFFKELCAGMKPADDAIETLPFAHAALLAYRHRASKPVLRERHTSVSYGSGHGALPPEKPRQPAGPLYGGEVLDMRTRGI